MMPRTQRTTGPQYVRVGYTIPLPMAGVGLLARVSTSVAADTDHCARQLLWVVVGTIAAGLIAAQDYRLVARLAYPALAIGILLLLLVSVAGTSINGSKRWLALGEFSVQPSELVKLTVVLVAARYFSDHPTKNGRGLKDLIVPAALIVIPFLQIAAQPDLGTGLTLWLIFGTVVAFDRIKPSLTIALIGGLLISLPLAW